MKHVLRRLAKSPLFTALTVSTLALGIGANVAIFSVINGVLLKPLPYPHPEELIGVNHSAPGVNIPEAGMAPFLYLTYLGQNRTFAQLGMWSGDSVSVTGLAEPEQVDAVDITEGVFRAFDVPPAAGRWFSPQDDTPGSPETVVLAYRYWQSKFGADPSVIGRRIRIDGRDHEVIGVMPESFRFLDLHPALFLPFRLDRNKVFLGQFSFQALARLKRGVSLSAASADLARLIPVALRSYPPFPGYNTRMFEEARLAPSLRPLKNDLIGDVGKTLWVLMATIGMVLLIACANVANLLLVRAEGRRHELAIRAALGAGRRQIARELLSESVTLGLLGGTAGLGLAYGGLRLLLAMAPAHLPRIDQIDIDGSVLAFTLAVSLFAGLLFGTMPAIRSGGISVATVLRGGGRSLSQGRDRHRTRSALVVVQVALALVLLIGSGLMLRTFQALRNVQPGFTHPEQIETLRITIPESQVADPVATVRMEQSIVDKIATAPGVTAAGITSLVPMDDGGGWRDGIYAEDHVYSEGQLPPLRRFKFVSPGLLKTMGNALLAGRDFTWTDHYEMRHVVMVSGNMARELWGNPAAAIGKRIREGRTSPWREIVGVVADEREDGVNQNAPAVVYFPLLSGNFSGNAVFVRRSLAYMIRSPRTGTRGFLNDIQQAVWSVDPNLPLAAVHSLQEIYNKSIARTSFTLLMLAIAGGMALLIGLVGIYGVISYSVSQRTREIGIRLALGAGRQEVTGMFLRDGFMLAAIGIACGVAAALALTRLMGSLLFEVQPADPLTYGVVSLLLVAAAGLASAIPALRAMRVDPAEALRAE